MENKKLFVFDLDGTIVDTVEDIAASMNAVLNYYKLPIKPLEHYRKLVGNGTLNMVNKTLGDDFNAVEEAHFLFELNYREDCLVRSKPFPDIDVAMAAIVSSGHYLAVLTNKIQPLAQKIVAAMFPNVSFDAIVGLSPENKAKPDPETLLRLINQFKPVECFMIGDTIVDLQTARNAGINSIAVLWGYSSAKELQTMNPERLFSDVDSMLLSFGLEVVVPA
ncbi:HAD family hydrolase [Thalassolituus sp.]|uniref:HAD family hydrolase n=1 Tax=Thalassolituus sp. TaxID=2030822 RepID=UPI002A7F307A|nr:HAD family hydrolase [Thalassolituus sp.]